MSLANVIYAKPLRSENHASWVVVFFIHKNTILGFVMNRETMCESVLLSFLASKCCKYVNDITALRRSVCIRSYSGTYSVGKIRTTITPNTDTFHAVPTLNKIAKTAANTRQLISIKSPRLNL